jgi:hypothetical protein
MIILGRWKAILAWAGFSGLLAKGFIWLANLSPPYIPQWCAIFFLLIGALGGACYCTATEVSDDI